MNLVEQVEEEVEVENKDKVGDEGAYPHSFTPTEIQDDEEVREVPSHLEVIAHTKEGVKLSTTRDLPSTMYHQPEDL